MREIFTQENVRRLPRTFTVRAGFFAMTIAAVCMAAYLRWRIYQPRDLVSDALSRPCQFAVKDVPLTDFARKIKNISRLDVVLDERGLADSAISFSDNVSCDVRFASVAMALDIALKPLGLTWEITGKTIRITSSERRDEVEEVRFHNVADLSEIFQGIPVTRGHTSRPFMYHDVESFIAPDTWSAGPTSILRTSDNSCIYFLQFPWVHDETAALLDAIRQIKAGSKWPVKVVKPPYARYDGLLERALSTVVSVDFDKIPLCDAVRDLRIRAGVEIQLDARGLGDNQVSPVVPVTLRVTASLREVLDMLLCTFSLTCAADRGVVWVTSREEAENTFSIVIFPVADLLIPGADAYRDVLDIVNSITSYSDVVGLATMYGAVICLAPEPFQEKIAAAFDRIRTVREQPP